jgi:hypothetical protein
MGVNSGAAYRATSFTLPRIEFWVLFLVVGDSCKIADWSSKKFIMGMKRTQSK